MPNHTGRLHTRLPMNTRTHGCKVPDGCQGSQEHLGCCLKTAIRQRQSHVRRQDASACHKVLLDQERRQAHRIVIVVQSNLDQNDLALIDCWQHAVHW
jgi:hypothetical protein